LLVVAEKAGIEGALRLEPMLPTSIVDPGESVHTRLFPATEAPNVGTGLIVPAVLELIGG